MARLRAALVTATALVAGVVPATVAAAAPVTAGTVTAGATETAEAGTVVQEGGPLVVRTGQAAVTTRITVTLPETVAGAVTPRLDIGLPTPSAGDEYVPDTACSVNGEPFEDCNWGWWNPDDVTPLPATMAQRTITYDIRISALAHYAYAGERDGRLEMRDSDGTVVASGPVGFHFVPGTPEAGDRTTVHARDKDGVLWQYESTADPARPFKPRTRVGGGWNGYTALTKLSWTTASGHGSLVARDKDGVLWYHEGSGDPAAPFKPRVREGGGWNTYNAVRGTGDIDGWSGRDGIARDTAGNLWLYKDTPAATRIKIGWSWQIYNAIV
ncbi:hypothetical protein [Streptomyces exfoliatus]|uniref:hypothetical protein n=1 Tax=Streptomyces exfoliatus TaxID=1905 RepID=UPI0037888EA0